MACLSLGFLEALIVWLIVLAALVAIIKLIVPWLENLWLV